jgi:large subunit ribosomal protein L21
MFAVIKTGGKQYRVAAEDMIKVDRIKGDRGEVIQFGEVLVLGGDSVILGAPTIAGASVAGEVIEQGRGPKIIAFKKRRRKNSRRKRGFRQEFTLVRITEILTDGQAPSKTAKPKAARKPVKTAAAVGADEGAATATATAASAKGKAKAKPKAARAKSSAGKPGKAGKTGKK